MPMKIEYNNHEFDDDQPCKHCGRTKQEIFENPELHCTALIKPAQPSTTSRRPHDNIYIGPDTGREE